LGIGASTTEALVAYINKKLDYLHTSRPTAVDLANAIRNLKAKTAKIAQESATYDAQIACKNIRECYIDAANEIFKKDNETNKRIGRYGAEYLRAQQQPIETAIDPQDELRYYTTSPPGTQGAADKTYRKISVLTHCNTG
jgi:methylthioribose-1-phosphate isomerase